MSGFGSVEFSFLTLYQLLNYNHCLCQIFTILLNLINLLHNPVPWIFNLEHREVCLNV